jgi:2-polyprenyl-3-methyl-5-hydroxy-6-metoxy-1,4-benzoquinol methylase
MDGFHANCLICGSDRLKDLEGYQGSYLTKCKKCDFVFSRKIPSQQELVDLYKEYSYGGPSFLSAITIQRYSELLDEFEKFRKTNRLIDVGCGEGFFLDEAKKRGWEVYGTEFSETAVENCRRRGITMIEGVLDPAKINARDFDIVTSFEVIEHINNPVPEVRNIAKLLRTGGLYYTTTPNFNGLLRYWLKGKYNVICYPEHISYYTPKTLNYLYENNGFKRLKILTSGISLTRIKTSMGTSDQMIISETSDDEKLRVKIEGSKALGFFKKLLNGFFNLTSTGLSIKAYYVKR